MELRNTPPPEKGVAPHLTTRLVCELADSCGFQLAGVAAPNPPPDFGRFLDWANRGLAGEMKYLTDYRADLRRSASNLLPGVRSIISLGMVYNGPQPYSTEFSDEDRGWISRYAWGEDYHSLIRQRLRQLAHKLLHHEEFRWRACVDTAPMLERSFGQQAGLGWIGKNTCLINERLGSWFFLGELLTTLDLQPTDNPAPDRCGTCTRCIQACPTQAIVPVPNSGTLQESGFEIDSRLCISYFTIELRGSIPESHRSRMGANVFGCDICQDVCPWNSARRSVETAEAAFQPREFAPSLERLAALSPQEFRDMFRDAPVSRAKYSGFLRNVAVAMGNAGLPKFVEPLERLAMDDDPVIAEHARWALSRMPDV